MKSKSYIALIVAAVFLMGASAVYRYEIYVGGGPSDADGGSYLDYQGNGTFSGTVDAGQLSLSGWEALRIDGIDTYLSTDGTTSRLNLEASGSMQFFIDTNNDQSDRTFAWRYNDDQDGGGASYLMTLSESSGLRVLDDATIDNDLDVTGGIARIGSDDSVAGDVNAYGDSDTTGGELRLYNGANDDTTVENFTFFANGDHVSFGQNGTSPDFNRVKFYDTGNIDMEGDLAVSGMQDIGTSFSANGDADDLVIGNGVATSGITLHTNATGRPSIFFADTGGNAVGRITYQHNGNTLELYTNGSKKMSIKGSGEITDLSIHNNGGTGSAETIASGTYTPTFTGAANYTSVSGNTGTWKRVGDVVSVTIYGSVTHTSTSTLTLYNVSLPVSSNLTTAGDLSGDVSKLQSRASAYVEQNVALDTALVSYTSNSTATHDVLIQFDYIVQ